MKKKIFNIFMLVAATVAFVSCGDDDSEGLTRITYYPTIELEGDDYIILDKGSEWVEPGYTSLMNGEDVSDLVTISGNVDSNTSGIYTLTYYTTKNDDGFSASASRTVVVLDQNDPIEGFYLVDGAASYRDYNGQVAYNRDNLELLIFNNGDGTITVDDLLGGWYAQRAGYGENYAMKGLLALAGDGSLSLLNSYVPGWGDGLSDFKGSYDAATSTFTWDATYTDYPFVFHVVLTKE